MLEVSGIGVPLIGSRTERKPSRRTRKRSVQELDKNFWVPIWCGARRTLWVVVLNENNNNHMGDPGCKSLNLVFQIEAGSYGKHTGHLCYDCWPTNPTARRSDRFWNAPASQHMGVHWAEWAEVEQSHSHGVSKKVQCDNDAWHVHREVSDSAPTSSTKMLQETFDVLSNKARGKMFGKAQEYVSVQLECLVGTALWHICLIERLCWAWQVAHTDQFARRQEALGAVWKKRDPSPRRTCVPSATVCPNTIIHVSWRGSRAEIRRKSYQHCVSFLQWNEQATCLDYVVTMQYGHERETCSVFRGLKRSGLLQNGDGMVKRRFNG